MAYLLDTCALSEFTKPRPSPSVDRWFAAMPRGSGYVSVLTIGELEKGIARLGSTKRRAELERWFAEIRTRFAGRTLDVDTAVALEWGRLSARADTSGKTVPVIDALIAATAIVHGLTIVTRNTSDIARAGAPVIDPWE